MIDSVSRNREWTRINANYGMQIPEGADQVLRISGIVCKVRSTPLENRRITAQMELAGSVGLESAENSS